MQEESNVIIGLPINISAGDGSLELAGVAQRLSLARCMLCFSCLHFLMFFLMVCTCLSKNPLDCGNLGDEVGCWMPHLWTKSWNGFPMYCGPLSLTISLGQPTSDTAFLISSVTFSLVVACRGVTMGYFEK